MIPVEPPFIQKIREFQALTDEKTKLIPAKDLVEILLRMLTALYLSEHASFDSDLTLQLRSFLSRKWKNPTTGTWETSLEKFRKARAKLKNPQSDSWFETKVEIPFAQLLGDSKKDKPPSVLGSLSDFRNQIAHFYSHADDTKIEELSRLSISLFEVYHKSPISDLKFWLEDKLVYCGITEKESFLLSPLFLYFEGGFQFFDGIDFSGNPLYLSSKEGGRKKYIERKEELEKSLPLLKWEDDIGMTYIARLKKWGDEYKDGFKQSITENKIKKFILNNKEGVLLLRGEIGSGKTILLSNILNGFMESKLESENSIEFIEFIGRGMDLNFLPDPNTKKHLRNLSVEKSFFFAYLFRKTQEIVGRNTFDLEFPRSEESAILLVSKLASYLENSSKKIVFVIDSIEDIHPKLQDLIPFGLKNCLYILATKITSGEIQVLQEKEIVLQELTLPVLQVEESKKYFLKSLGSEKKLVNEKNLERILSLTQGNLLFLKIWADSIRIGKIYTNDIPEEILSYYADFFENLRKKEKSTEYLRPLIILASAEKSVSFEILLTILKWEETYFWKIVSSVRHLIREQDGFFSLIHPTLKEYLLLEYLVPIRRVKETYYLPLMDSESIEKFPYADFKSFQSELNQWKNKQENKTLVYDKSYYQLRARYKI